MYNSQKINVLTIMDLRNDFKFSTACVYLFNDIKHQTNRNGIILLVLGYTSGRNLVTTDHYISIQVTYYCCLVLCSQ